MRAQVMAAFLALASSPASVIAGEYSPPSPDLLQELRREHRQGDWLRVTTDSVRWEARVLVIAPDGLRGLIVRPSAPAAPKIVPWSVISRIDVRTSRFRFGQAMGIVLGGVLGAAVGGGFGAQTDNAALGVLEGLAIGVPGGAWLGGTLGDQIVHERPFYAAAPQRASPDLDGTRPEIAGPLAGKEPSAGGAPAQVPSAESTASPRPAETPSTSRSDSLETAGLRAEPGVRKVEGGAAATNEEPSANAFGAPPPNLLFQLQRSNRSHPWLHVSTDSVRMTLRTGRIDAYGLSELRAREPAAPTPAPIPWRRVRQIDERATAAHQVGTWGFVLLGAGGAMLGNAIGAPDHTGGRDALLGLGVMGGVGAWLGSRLGARSVHQVPWYVGVPAETGGARRPTTVAAEPSDRVLRACNQIPPGKQLRISADFGKFQGYAGIVGPQGLEALRQDPRARAPYDASAPAEMVAWNRIQQVDVHGQSTLTGALVTGSAVGTAGGLLGAAVVFAFGGDGREALGGFGIGFGIAGGVGAVVGGLVGAMIPHWQRVYEAP